MDKQKVCCGVFVLSFLCLFSPPLLFGQEDIRALREEIGKMREDSEKQRQRMQALEEKLQNMEAQSAKKEKEVDEKIASQTGSWVDRYLKTQTGDSRFLLTVDGFGGYTWRSKFGNQNEKLNTFQGGLSPVLLLRLNDWIMFESEIEFELKGTETEVGVEYAQVLAFLNDYVTLGAGKFLRPFGEYFERLEPKSVNKFVTNPLPYREADEGGLVNIAEVGAQLRGVIPFGTSAGPQVEYALYVGNGPRFSSSERGATLENNHTDNNAAKAWGGRLGIRPLPFDWDLGRLKVGASTYNGIWGKGRWLNVWGLDASYQYEPFEVRGEYLGFLRDMPFGEKKDNRNGWYLQTAYKLSDVPIQFIDRSEVVLRFSGVNSPRIPDFADAEHPFVKRPRQISLGWDYHVNSSSTWKLEFDRDFPRGAKAGSQFLTQWVTRF
jgi:uncharacterized coiled-coil protein SlyX